MQQILLQLVTFVHILFVLFVVLTPFTNSNYLLLLHSITIPFIIIHWLMNDDTCVLTMVERNIKKGLYGDAYKEEECLTCRLIEPVYNFVNDNRTFSKIIYIITILLWSISVGKLVYKYKTGKINDWKQLFVL